jgi:hypothetical protein
MKKPAVPVIMHDFEKQEKEVSLNLGMPGLRIQYFRGPVWGKTNEQIRKQVIEGNNPITGKPVMQELVEKLTKPLTAEEKKTGEVRQDTGPPTYTGTPDELQKLFLENRYTDFLPVVLPTEDKVNEMLKATSHEPDEVLGKMNPGSEAGDTWSYTVRVAAINAVMAGAKPEYFPTILAAAAQAPSFGNSTSSMANMIVVNGPIRKQLGMNAGTDAMGPFSEANSVIGRAFTLAGKLLGNLRIGAGAYSTLGSSLQYNNVCFAENEEELPQGWEPLSVEQGFRRTDNVINIGIGWSYISSVGEAQRSHPPQMLIGDYMRSLAGSGATIVVDPTVARLLKDVYGFKTKAELSQWLSNYVEVTAATFWGNGVNASATSPLAFQGLEPYATWLKLPPDTRIKPFTNPKAIQVVVAGGGIQTTWFVTDFRFSRGILIDEWK